MFLEPVKNFYFRDFNLIHPLWQDNTGLDTLFVITQILPLERKISINDYIKFKIQSVITAVTSLKGSWKLT